MASKYQQRFLQQAAKLDAIGDRAGAALRRGMAREYDAWPADKRATADHMESTPGAVRCACDGNVCACEPFSRPTQQPNTRDDSAAARDEMIARLRGNAKRDDAQRDDSDDAQRDDSDDAQRDDAKPEPLGTPEQERARLIERMQKAAR